MSKTVLKQGTDPQHTYISKCENCGTIFSYFYSDMEGDPIQAWHEPHVTCPTCGYMMAFNSKPTEKIDYTINGAGIILPPNSIEIPTGCSAYVMYNNGGVLTLLDVSSEAITPSRAPILIIGSCSQITLVPGVEILNPKPNYSYLKVQKLLDKKSPYLRVNSSFEYEEILDTDVDQYGIVNTTILTNSEIIRI